MRRSILACFLIALLSAAIVSSHAQTAPSASSRSFNVFAGGLFSAFQPDYMNTGSAQTSPNRLYGFGAYADAHFSRWVQIEAEARWLHFNQFASVDQNTYSIGPRIPVLTFHKFEPYGKFLVGFGNGSFLTSNALVLTFGGGVDYRLNRKFTLRPFDFEYQRWSVVPSTIWPYGASAGLSYRVF
ncbi:MAG: outer membrane beta-barrel protein [Terracidiphilus sp.]